MERHRDAFCSDALFFGVSHFNLTLLTREGCETLMLSIFEHVAKVAKSEQPHVAEDPRFDIETDGSLKPHKDVLPDDLANDPRFSS